LHDFTASSPVAVKSVAPAAPDIYAVAERRMRRGKRLVISGFVVTVAGIIGYCLACFGASQNVTARSIEEAGWFVTPALGVLGLGTLLWLVGSFLFLCGAMDGDPEGPDLHF
jgi:hypothetical protein